jgi:NtrC-family two-component system response regulator AlgB
MATVDVEWSCLIVDDDAGIRQSLRLCLEAGVGVARVVTAEAAESALAALDRAEFDVVLLDVQLGADSGLDLIPEMLRREPRLGIIVITAFATFDTAVLAMRLGAINYLAKPFTPDQVRRAVRPFVERRARQRHLFEVEDRIGKSEAELLFDSESPAYRTFLEVAARAAQADCTILLRGESGTGKNVLARWLHDHSPRARGSFVSVNCPALSGELVVSLLFGHLRGAFTDATTDAFGKVQEAEGGTLFLDEVGDLGLEAQARLLRFLSDHRYERVGEAKEHHADVRVIGATNRALEMDVREGRFREDLLFRLGVVVLLIPTLRERPEDILTLARHYLELFGARQHRALELSRRAEQAILHHDWPGNLRQLRNAVERATILSPSHVLEPGDLGLDEKGQAWNARRVTDIVPGDEVSIEQVEREHIARVVMRSPSLEAAARTLAIDTSTLQRKRKRFGLA